MMGRFLLDAMFVLIIIMIGSLLITNDEKSVDINDELQNFDALIVNGNVVEDGYLENADKVIYDDGNLVALMGDKLSDGIVNGVNFGVDLISKAIGAVID